MSLIKLYGEKKYKVFDFISYYMHRISPFWWCIIIGSMIFCFEINLRKKKDGKLNIYQALARSLIVPYFIGLLCLTVFIRHPNNEYNAILVPFQAFREYFQYRTTTLLLLILYNYAVFVPLGFLLPTCSYRIKSRFINSKLTILFGFLLSLCIETFQYISRYGYFEVDDIMFNVTGTVIGVLLYIVLKKIIAKKAK